MLEIIQEVILVKDFARDSFSRKLPKGAQFLRIDANQDTLYITFLADRVNPEETRHFRAYIYLYNDKWLASEKMDNLIYLGTLAMPINIRLLHLFELKKV